MSAPLSTQTYSLPEDLQQAVNATLEDWRTNNKVKKLWAKDATLWTNADESHWLGWLDMTETQLATIAHLTGIADEIKREGFSHALLLGMGGSSLCPEVMKLTFGKQADFPDLYVLDSTDPAQIKTVEGKVDVANCIFIVSSKSGSTLEPNIFKQYFFERVKQTLGADQAGSRFIAITDPNSQMQRVAEGDNFRHIFFGLPSIGGRYSALSDFGMVPAAVMGADVPRFLASTKRMVDACKADEPLDNPGVVLGAILGTLANHGRDKLTIIASPAIADLGAWLEQLLAESTGKEGKGIIPVDREHLGGLQDYGHDRVFAYLRLDSAPNELQDTAIDALEHAGHPVVRIALADVYDLGQEFFRWEIATAVAGAVIGINPFNQPDVEASKIVTKELTSAYEATGALPAEEALLNEDGIKLFTDQKNAARLKQAVGDDQTLFGYIKAHLDSAVAGDYIAFLAYVEMNDAHEALMQTPRHQVRDNKRLATCLGFGPRFLHSTGQAYKGGPNSGVFLQITADDAEDLPVPEQRYTFGIVKAAQARGDFQVLADRQRRALRVHLGADVSRGLEKLRAAIEQALV
ncbi:MAG: bifunctional transaldolase/phosoglucose isomerase [Acidobacteria bacterium]|nr:bifunctional transaldolase/phosoglucose isomerase [Acidobacteriota bacterium]